MLMMQVYIQVYQWNARESMNKPHKNLVYEKSGITKQWGGNQQCETSGYPSRKIKLDLYLTPHIKTNSKGVQNVHEKIKPESIKRKNHKAFIHTHACRGPRKKWEQESVFLADTFYSVVGFFWEDHLKV